LEIFMAIDREDPNVVINRLEGHINGMRTANPSGAETLHDHITAELANLRRAINGPTDAEKARDERNAQKQAEADKAKADRGDQGMSGPERAAAQQRIQQETDSVNASAAGRAPASPKVTGL
jgi:hypothetical protein